MLGRTLSTPLSNRLWRAVRLPVILLCIFILGTQTSANARNQRVLAVCQQRGFASADFMGNPKKGRTKLMSSGPRAYAGFEFEGLAGTKIADMNSMFLLFDPAPADRATFYLRVKVDESQSQLFTIGPNAEPNLPNIPIDDSVDQLKSANIQRFELIQSNSILKLTDTIRKVSFLFTANTQSRTSQQMFVDEFRYNFAPVPILLDEGGCDDLF